MTPIIITLIIIGVALIIVSCLFIDKSSDKNSDNADLISASYINSSDVKRKVEDSLLEVSEVTLAKTEDELSKISNEKIIAVNDFSNIVLDKITTNHEEVVFLYNMLNEKEAELKDIINQVNELKNQQQSKEVYDTQQSSILVSTKELEYNTDHISEDSLYSNNISESELNNIYDELALNNNQMILRLYKEGKSIVDIAKALKLGQGEVKLVIDLYR